MSPSDDIAAFGRAIDEYDRAVPAWHVVTDEPDETWPPPDMRGRQLDSPDWVECRVLPSTLGTGDIEAIEREFCIEFPHAFRAYLLARFHLYDQLRAPRHEGRQTFWTPIPSRDSLKPLRKRIRGWAALLPAGYIPIAEWGDGWGPMCFDTRRRDPSGECPVVWMDHELLFRIGVGRCGDRLNVEPLAQPLYPTSRELLVDIFSPPPPSAQV